MSIEGVKGSESREKINKSSAPLEKNSYIVSLKMVFLRIWEKEGQMVDSFGSARNDQSSGSFYQLTRIANVNGYRISSAWRYQENIEAKLI